VQAEAAKNELMASEAAKAAESDALRARTRGNELIGDETGAGQHGVATATVGARRSVAMTSEWGTSRRDALDCPPARDH